MMKTVPRIVLPNLASAPDAGQYAAPSEPERRTMNNYSSVLAVAGSLCLTITLVLAWCLVGVRSSAFMKKVFPSYQQLLKAHMDYLLMSGLLMIF